MSKKVNDEEVDQDLKLVSLSLSFIFVASFIVIAMGICTIVFGYSLVHGKFEFSRDWPDFSQFANFDASTFDRAVFADLILMCGTFAILTGLMGCASYQWKKSYFLCPFGVLAALFGVVLIISGIASLNFDVVVEESYKQMCVKDRLESDKIKNILAQTINKHMCSSNCPCWSGGAKNLYEPATGPVASVGFESSTYRNFALFGGYMGSDEMAMHNFGRTKF